MKPNLKPEIEALLKKYKAATVTAARIWAETEPGEIRVRLTGEIDALWKIIEDLEKLIEVKDGN